MSIHAAQARSDAAAFLKTQRSSASRSEREPRLAPGALLRACGLPLEVVVALLGAVTTPDEAVDRAIGEGLLAEVTLLAILASRIGELVLENAPPPR